MIRTPARRRFRLAPGLALAASLATPLAAQQPPGSFTLPTATPAPGPAPAGPADERAGVAIPPRPAPAPAPSPTALPTVRPAASPAPPTAASRVPLDLPAPPRAAPDRESAPQARASAPSAPPAPADPAIAGNPAIEGGPSPAASGGQEAMPGAEALPAPESASPAPQSIVPAGNLPAWWPWAAGALGAAAVLGGGVLLWRRRRPGAPRLAAPSGSAMSDTAAAGSAPGSDPARLDLAIEITGATRSVMMFTLEYRLTLANRSERAVCDLAVAVQLACARGSAGASGDNAPSAGAAQHLDTVGRIGPHQARSIAGTVQLPLSAIAPLRQGSTPLFVPLVHVTLEGDGQRALAKSFVIGTPSASGRVHPIRLDQPPGSIVGLVAQGIAVPRMPAAA
jgi:hypothetical protein